MDQIWALEKYSIQIIFISGNKIEGRSAFFMSGIIQALTRSVWICRLTHKKTHKITKQQLYFITCQVNLFVVSYMLDYTYIIYIYHIFK